MEEILAIIDSNEFNYKNKIGEFRYIGIKDLVNNIKVNTISETDAQKSLNTLYEIKNVETIKYKKCTSKQKELLNLFSDLSDIILIDKTLESESQENEKVESRKEENEKEENENEDYENENEYEDNEHEDDENETMDQNEIIKGLNNDLDKIINKSKSVEDQIKLLKKLEDLKGYLPHNDYDNKKLKSLTRQMRLTKSYLNKYLVIHLQN